MSVRSLSQQKLSRQIYNKTSSVVLPKGSAYFNGSSYLRMPSNSALAFSTGDFTVEMWVKASNSGYQQWITSPGNGDRSGIAIGSRWGSFWWLFGDGSSWVFERNFGSFSVNTWYHVAVVRSGTTASVYVNGTLGDSVTNSTNLGQGTSWDIGALVPNGYYLTGWMSNVRAIKGTAKYTGNFTVPTSPLSAASSSLLTCVDPSSVTHDYAPTPNTITSYGATAASVSPFA